MTFIKPETDFLSKVLHFDGAKMENALLLDYQKESNFVTICLADGVARVVPLTEVHDPDLVRTMRSAFRHKYAVQTLWERFCGLFRRKTRNHTGKAQEDA